MCLLTTTCCNHVHAFFIVLLQCIPYAGWQFFSTPVYDLPSGIQCAVIGVLGELDSTSLTPTSTWSTLSPRSFVEVKGRLLLLEQTLSLRRTVRVRGRMFKNVYKAASMIVPSQHIILRTMHMANPLLVFWRGRGPFCYQELPASSCSSQFVFGVPY